MFDDVSKHEVLVFLDQVAAVEETASVRGGCVAEVGEGGGGSVTEVAKAVSGL